MRGADAYFIWSESRARHMHTLKVLVVDPSTAHTPVSFERFCAGAGRALPCLAAFRRRVIRAPLGIGHPLWLEAPELDLAYHLRHEVLPPGAGHERLDELLSRIASEPLDHSRPLWQIFFVEGLPGGRIAYVTKLHHALADGSASAALVLYALQQGPEPVQLPAPYAGSGDPVPPAGRRLLRGLGRELLRQRELPSLLMRSIRGLHIAAQRQRAGHPIPARAFASPHTRFNRPVTPDRVYAHARLSLSALREVKAGFGCSLNDVYLAVVGGALRRYLDHHGEPSTPPLTAAVPVSVRDERDDPLFGNATAYWFASTASDVDDPAERLRAVVASTGAARTLFEKRDPRLAIDWFDHWPLRRVYLEGLALIGSALVGRPTFNVIVSNVRGPAVPIYSDGARVEALFSMGPLSLQQGLNFTAWSYLDDFTVGVHACRQHVPDVGRLADGLAAELEQLSAAAAALPTRAA